ncbi:MAG: SDR family NAD(P)-dependent oxidoreductase, partial [Acidobacteria bacterium]|nr:SDR family NAD(P)-dependent oxidoreductase [Acidobacteriota bacterium]
IALALKELASAEALDLRVIELDVTSEESVALAAAKVLEESGGPDVVINNAGQMFVGFTEAFSSDELTKQLDVNVVGTHRMSRAFLPAMRERGEGLIVNISSIAGRFGVPFFGVYHASKWAVEGYSMALRGELASCGVDVVVVEPGPFTTELFPSSPRPADVEGRVETYPAVARDTFEGMGSAFESMFEDPAMPTDPQAVVDRIIELSEMKPGSRPFRSVVGVDFGTEDRNAAVEPFDSAVLEAFGMTSFAKLVTNK